MIPITPNVNTLPLRPAGNIPVLSPTPKERASTRYDELGELSRGGCGLVLRAFDRHLQREVVLKKILPEIQRDIEVESRFLHEARITAQLAHPGIVPVHDMGTDPETGSRYYAMKWLHGETLADSIVRHHSQNPSRPAETTRVRAQHELLSRFQQVCKTVAFAHQQGVVHRDLKPSNILLGEFGETTVLDWGLAKLMPHSKLVAESSIMSSSSNDPNLSIGRNAPEETKKPEKPQELTSAGSLLGTASYMSPEQARGESHAVDARSDVFSLGCILYEILTGSSPFLCPTFHETIQHVIRVEYVRIRKKAPWVPRSLEAICEKALRLDPNARYANASELERDIDAFLAGAPVQAYPEPWWATIDRLAKKHRFVVWTSFASLSILTLVSMVSTGVVHRANVEERMARIYAEKEHAEKTIALESEEIAHKEAVTQLQSAREAVDEWILGLDSDLKLYPGLNELRLHLLDRAELHYKKLANQRCDRGLLTLEVARAEIRLGDVEKINGHNDQAVDCYQSGLRLLESSQTLAESDWFPIEQIQKAKSLLGLASLAIETGTDVKKAPRSIDEAILAVGQIQPSSMEYSEARRTEAFARQLRASYLFASGEIQQATEEIEKGIAILDLHSENLTLLDNQRGLVRMLEDLAKYRYDLCDFANAQGAYQRIIHVYDQLLSDGRKRPDWLESRANAELQSAACHSQQVQPIEAVAALEAAEEDLRNAWKIFGGEAMYHDKVANVYNGMGHSFLLVGDSEQAERILKLSLESMQRSVANNQPTPQLLKRMIQNQLWLALAIDHQENSDFAMQLEQAELNLKRLLTLQKVDPDIDFLMTQRAWLRSRHQILVGDLDGAEKTIEEEFQREMSAPHRDFSLGYHDLYQGRLQMNLTTIHSERNNPQEERASKRRAREHWKMAAQTVGRASAMAAFSLLQSWCEDEALTDNERIDCITLANSMVEQHSTSPTAWFWLAETSYRFGEKETAEMATRKLERLRKRVTLEDSLLLQLIRGMETMHPAHSQSSPVTRPLRKGTHAWNLQELHKKTLAKGSHPQDGKKE